MESKISTIQEILDKHISVYGREVGESLDEIYDAMEEYAAQFKQAEQCAGVWVNCRNLPNGFTQLVVRSIPDKKKYLVGKAGNHLILNENIIEGAELEQWEYLNESQQSQPHSAGKLYTENQIRQAIVLSATSPIDDLPKRCDHILENFIKPESQPAYAL